MELDTLSLSELRALMREWYEAAHRDGTLKTLAFIARELGRDPVSIKNPGYRSTYGPKYLFVTGDVYVYVDDYGGYMTVYVGGEHEQRVCSTHDTDRIFVPGEWVGMVLSHYEAARAAADAREAAACEQERQQLLKQTRPV